MIRTIQLKKPTPDYVLLSGLKTAQIEQVNADRNFPSEQEESTRIAGNSELADELFDRDAGLFQNSAKGSGGEFRV